MARANASRWTKYSDKKRLCGYDNIEFNLTFEEFDSWWAENEKQGKIMGQGKGKYHMGRKDHSKGYSLDNIICQTHEENCGEPIRSGRCPHPTKGRPLSDQHKRKLSVSLSGENNPFYGKTHSEEIRKLCAEGARNQEPYKRTDEHRKEMSEIKKRQWAEKKARENMDY